MDINLVGKFLQPVVASVVLPTANLKLFGAFVPGTMFNVTPTLSTVFLTLNQVKNSNVAVSTGGDLETKYYTMANNLLQGVIPVMTNTPNLLANAAVNPAVVNAVNGIINNALTNNPVPFGKLIVPFTTFVIIVAMLVSLSFTILLWILLAVINYCCVMDKKRREGSVFCCCNKKKKRRKSYENSRRLLNKVAEDTMDPDLKQTRTCLALNDRTHWIVTGVITFLLPATISLFVVAQFTPAFTAMVTLTNGAGAQPMVANTQDFTLWQFVVLLSGMASGKGLGFFIAFVSGAWPLFRMTLLFFIFIIPVRSTSRTVLRIRREVLMIFEHFSKWSFGFIYVIVGLMAIFSFAVTNGNNQTITLSFQIQPGFAMYLVALFTSYIATYLVLVTHRRSVLVVARKDLEDNDKVSISNVLFARKRKIIGPLITFVVFIVSFALILFGINLNGFNVTYQGALPLALGTRPFTYFNFVNTVVTTTAAGAAIFRALQALYYILGIGFPIFHLILLALLWFVPFSVPLQGLVFSITEITSAWASLEVFLVAILTLLQSLPAVSAILVGPACVALNNIMAGVINPAQAVCLNAAAKVDVGLGLSLTGAFLYVLAANVVIRAGAWVLRYRIRGGIETERRKITPDDSLGSDPDYITPGEESYESAQSYSGSRSSRRVYR
jgi:hypothetical protein